MSAHLRPAAGALAAGLLAGACASPYVSLGQPNMTVRTSTGERTIFAATNARLEVQRVLPGCRGEAEGQVFLGGAVETLHLPAGRLSNLVFKFRTSSVWGQWSRETSYTTLIRPRPGFTYEATVSFANDLFTIDVVEVGPHKGAPRKLPRQDIADCQRA
jgi:hypothetical protein